MYLHTQYRKAKETSTQYLVLGDSSLKFLREESSDSQSKWAAAAAAPPVGAWQYCWSGERRERDAKSGGGWGGGRPSEGGHDMVGFSKWA